MKTAKNSNDSLDLYFGKNDDKKLYVPDVEVKNVAADQKMIELRGFNHLRAVENADGSYAGIYTMFRPADDSQ